MSPGSAVSERPHASELAPVEREVLDFFVHLGRYASLPRSVGEIYGLLFARGKKLTLDDLVHILSISKGSASQGLRMLRELGAVRVHYVPGDRKDYYEAETELPTLLRGFLRDQLEAKLVQTGQKLDSLCEAAVDEAQGASEGLAERLERLRAWQTKARRLFPLVSTFLKM